MPRTVTQIQFPTPIPKARRVAAYARVSSDKDTMLHSLAAQVDYYSTYIRHHPGWAYVGVYADEAKTGTRDSRENFQRMLADCRAGKIDHIITKSVSRFSRNTVTLLETIRELKGLGISVYFEEQSIDTSTADGELMLSILASYAQEESLSASENQKWRVRRNFEQGIPWRFFMLGYRRENGKLVVVPEEADIVRGIFRDYLDGKGTAAIVKRLNEEGYATQSGCVFHKSAVDRILRNYAYTGNLLLQTKFRENHLTKITRKNQGELPQYHAANTHEAIIPPETFQAVQDEIQRRKEKYAPAKPRKVSLFSGLITCAICGKHYRRKTTGTGPVWICSTYNSYGKAHCPSKAVPEEKLMQTAAQVGPVSEITAITARNGNLLEFTLKDGTKAVKRWQDRSRAESWTEEMRRAAGEKTRERKKDHDES
ncbi:MAG TPA: recombinase family protein [Candidatus Scatomorpha gallistercoris]|nr:recombinase family protein [Candidatus Scatomorpha gallistercoris]